MPWTFDPLLFHFLAGNGRHSQKKTGAKPKKLNWFEHLSVDELKQLCKGSKQKVSGTKKELVARLLENESTSKFGEKSTTLESVKEMCRQRLLQVSGTKFTLVLQTLYHDHGTSPESGAIKRAATEIETVIDETTGEAKEVVVAKKRRKTAGPADLDKIYQKVKRKMEAVKQKKYQSRYGSKCHAPDVYKLIHDILQEECIDKGFVTADPKFALSVAKAAFTSFSDHWQVMERTGYEPEVFNFALDLLQQIVQEAGPLLAPEEALATAEWMEELDACIKSDCVLGDANYDKYYVNRLPGPDTKGRHLVNMVKILCPEREFAKKPRKMLNCEINSIKWMNGLA